MQDIHSKRLSDTKKELYDHRPSSLPGEIVISSLPVLDI